MSTPNLPLGELDARIAPLVAVVQRAGEPEGRAAAYEQLGAVYAAAGDRDSASACYQQALDLDWRRTEAFERAATLLLDAGDWRGVEEHHRLMLERLEHSGSVQLRAALWKNLGQIHRVHLGRPDDAVLAYESALRLQPEDPQAAQALEALYRELGQTPAPARERVHRVLLEHDPARVDSVRGLLQALGDQGDHDAAWCVAARLVCEGEATPEEEAFFYNAARPAPPAPGAIAESLWARCLRHPDDSSELEALLAAVAPSLYPLLASDPEPLLPRGHHPVDPAAPLPINECVRRCLRALGWSAELPAVLRTPGAECRLLATLPPVLLVGEELFVGRSLPQLLAVVAPELSWLRAGHLLLRALDEAARPWLAACLLAGLAGQPWPDDSAPTRRVARALAELSGPGLERARSLAHGLVQGDGVGALPGHVAGVEHTGRRFALLLSEDLESLLLGAASAASRAALRAFAVAPQLAALRAALGMALPSVQGAPTADGGDRAAG